MANETGSNSDIGTNFDIREEEAVISSTIGAADNVIRCQVCDMPADLSNNASNSRKAGAQDPLPAACRACKKFFRRNRTRSINSLICLSGTGKCCVSKATATHIATGVVWRMACPRCRFNKCVAIGLHNTCRDSGSSNSNGKPRISNATISLSNNSSNCTPPTTVEDENKSTFEETPAIEAERSSPLGQQQSLALVANPPLQPVMRHYSEMETALHRLVNASSELLTSSLNAPLFTHVCRFSNEIDAWQNSMNQYDFLASSVSAFIKSMPGFCELPVDERCRVFSKIMLPMVYANTNRYRPTTVAMAPENSEQFLFYFPELAYSQQQSQFLHSIISSWNPNNVEHSCLLAYLFMQSYFSAKANCDSGQAMQINGNNSSDAKTLAKINDLQVVMRMSMLQQANGDVPVCNARLQQMMYVADMLQSCSDRYHVAAADLMRRCPHLFTTSQIYSAIHSQNWKQSSTSHPSIAVRQHEHQMETSNSENGGPSAM